MKYILDVSTFIDFDNFDGLTFKELFEFNVFNKDYLFFIIYGQIKYRDYSINNCIHVETIHRYKIDNLNQNIDTYISNYLMDIYDKRNIRIQKFIKSYLERYKYSYNEIDKVLTNNKLKNKKRK